MPIEAVKRTIEKRSEYHQKTLIMLETAMIKDT